MYKSWKKSKYSRYSETNRKLELIIICFRKYEVCSNECDNIKLNNLDYRKTIL